MVDIGTMSNVFGSATPEQIENARILADTLRLEKQILEIKKKMLDDQIAFYQAYTNNYQ